LLNSFNRTDFAMYAERSNDVGFGAAHDSGFANVRFTDGSRQLALLTFGQGDHLERAGLMTRRTYRRIERAVKAAVHSIATLARADSGGYFGRFGSATTCCHARTISRTEVEH
jgi:hypothetical protein